MLHTPDAVAPTDLNKTATELSDWLVLITQMLKSNIVTVGDIEEIRITMGRLQVSIMNNESFFIFLFSFVNSKLKALIVYDCVCVLVICAGR